VSEHIDQLRVALVATPGDRRVRRLLAEALLADDRPGEAEREYRMALKADPSSGPLRLGLAHAFAAGGKAGEAAVVLEGVLASPDTPAAARIGAVRVLLACGDRSQAAAQYALAVQSDGAVADDDLAAQIGVDARLASSGSITWDTDPAAAGEIPVPVGPAATTFADVGGMQAAKEALRLRVIVPLRRPDLTAHYGRRPGAHILLWGPPGCGKTLLSLAIAGELGVAPLVVGADDVLDPWSGESERNLHRHFEQARRGRPSVLLFDEVDALAARRRDTYAGGGRSLINQFLQELDGARDNEGILVIASTNAPWFLDPAFLRPGRFAPIFIAPPDTAGRREILSVLLRHLPADGADLDAVVARTQGLSGADLAAVVDRATDARLDEALRDGRPAPVTTRDLTRAAKSTRPSTADWFATARGYATFSNESGLYDEVLRHLGER